MARLNLSLLGPFQATLDDQPLRGFESDKARALLAYLAVESDRAHSREALADLLWPEYAPAAARTNLRNTLSNLRTLLRDREQAQPLFTVTAETIRFDRASDAQVDVCELAALLSGERAIGDLERAAALYQGDLLAGFALKDSAPFEDWLLLARERLRRQYLEALRQLAAAYEARGERELALANARRWAEADPWDEAAQREVMRLLALSGQRTAALAQYERCKQALADELGVEPEAATMQLYQEIRDGGLPPAASAPRPRSLPTPLMPLLGRERELTDLAAKLRDPSCRLLTILGPGGMGKTRLAIEFASRLKDEFGEAAFAPLSGVQEAEAITPAIAQSLGLAFRAATASPREQLLEYLRGKRRLVILDSFEHLLAGAPLLSELLEAAPGVKLLVTSRARLGLQHEQLFRLEGLALTQALTPTLSQGERENDALPSPFGGGVGGEGLTGREGFGEGNPAIELFLLGARRVRPDYAPGAADLAEIARVCRLVEGLPLAILLAASWMALLSPAEIAAQIERECFAFLEADWRDIPERQRSMRAVLDHSWRLLAPREQEALAALSVFRGSYKLEAAQAVTEAGLRDLLRLVDKSLLLRAAQGRYVLHDLLRQYAAEKLAASPERADAARDRHAAYYAARLAQLARELWSPREIAAEAEIYAEWAEIRAAWDRAVERARADWLGQSADALCDWWRFGRFAEGEALFARAAAALQEAFARRDSPPSGAELRVLGNLVGNAGWMIQKQNRWEPARQRFAEAARWLEQAEALGEDVRAVKGVNLRRLGEVSSSAEAAPLYQQSLALCREAGYRPGVAEALKRLGWLALHHGRDEEAWRFYAEALAAYRQIGAPEPLFDLFEYQGMNAIAHGDEAHVAEIVADGLALLRTADAKSIGPQPWFHLALDLLAVGRFAEAAPLFAEALARAREMGFRVELARMLIWCGQNEMNQGRVQEGRALAEEGLALTRAAGDHAQAAQSLYLLGRMAQMESDVAGMEKCLREAQSDLDAAGDSAQRAVTFSTLLRGDIAAARGDWATARRCMRQALQMDIAIKGYAWAMADIAPTIAAQLAHEGQIERAVELYALACRFGFVSRNAYYQTVSGRLIAEAAQALPPEVVAAAQERGRARAWRATAEELLAELDR